MIAKLTFFVVIIILQNFLLVNNVFTTEKYVEIDNIIAIVESNSITKLELNNKKEKIKKTFIQQELAIPNDKEITKLSLEQLITEKLVLEYALMKGIDISEEQLSNVLNDIAQSNNISIEDLIKEIEMDGSSFSNFREDIRKQLIFQQIKRRIISANLKISEFEIDSFIKLQKENTPTKYNYSHIFIEFIDGNKDLSTSKINEKLDKVINKLKENSFGEVAKAYSDSPMAKNGGLMGAKLIDEIPDIFIEPLRSMNMGEISEPIYTSSGIHIIKLNKIEEFQMETVVVRQSKVQQIMLKKNQIVSEDDIKKKLKHIRNSILEGMSFSDAAEKYSEDSSAANKGDLGWLSPGSTIPDFEKEMDKLDLNEISQPFKTSLGWHLIQVSDRREKDLSSESLRQRVKERLLARKTEVKFKDWVKSLREEAHIEIWLYEN